MRLAADDGISKAIADSSFDLGVEMRKNRMEKRAARTHLKLYGRRPPALPAADDALGGRSGGRRLAGVMSDVSVSVRVRCGQMGEAFECDVWTRLKYVRMAWDVRTCVMGAVCVPE